MLQKAHNVERMQEMINDGSCWNLEGSAGRFAMTCLESGACMLPLIPRVDYYGNRIPSRKELKRGTKGTFQNCVNFWNRVNSGDFDAIEWLEETFGFAEKLAV
jgi:hypothetical protein